MRTTLDLPEDLVSQAMDITKKKNKTELIKYALENIISQEKRNNIIKYHGRIKLDIDLDNMRNR